VESPKENSRTRFCKYTATLPNKSFRAGPTNSSLWAQFFFSRDHEGPTNPKYVFPDVTHKLRIRSPHSMAAFAIQVTLSKWPPIFWVILEPRPMKAEQVSHPQVLIVVVLDALDESKSQLRETARILARAAKHLVVRRFSSQLGQRKTSASIFFYPHGMATSHWQVEERGEEWLKLVWTFRQSAPLRIISVFCSLSTAIADWGVIFWVLRFPHA
jgi:hypothetical protein